MKIYLLFIGLLMMIGITDKTTENKTKIIQILLLIVSIVLLILNWKTINWLY